MNCEQLLPFLDKLELHKIYYELSKVRDAIMVKVSVPGERWEIEFFNGKEIEIEVFKSDGEIYEHHKLKQLFEEFGDAF